MAAVGGLVPLFVYVQVMGPPLLPIVSVLPLSVASPVHASAPA